MITILQIERGVNHDAIKTITGWISGNDWADICSKLPWGKRELTNVILQRAPINNVGKHYVGHDDTCDYWALVS